MTTDGHNSYPRAIRSTLGRDVRHRTSVHLNNRLEQDHRGSKDGSDVCAASRSIMRQRDFAARTTNFAISPAADRRERRSWRGSGGQLSHELSDAKCLCLLKTSSDAVMLL